MKVEGCEVLVEGRGCRNVETMVGWLVETCFSSWFPFFFLLTHAVLDCVLVECTV